MSNLIVKDGNAVDRYMQMEGAGTSGDPFVPIRKLKDTGAQKAMITQKLDTVGNASGATNMGVDGSVTPVKFLVKPGAGQIFRIARWILTIRDSGDFDVGGYGNNGGTPLTNGLLVQMLIDGVPTPLLEGVKSHVDIAALCYDFNYQSFGAGDNFAVARWTFTTTGQYVRLIGDDSDELSVTVRDDLTHLVDQSIYVQGYIE